MSTQLRPELPELPKHMRSMRIDERGYPVPWFACWLDDEGNQTPRGVGKPDFRVIGGDAIIEALRDERCWICGEKVGRYKAFVIGPMCVINRVNSEPPSHVDCADFAGRACPFLSRPHMHRREQGLPDGLVTPAGIASLRNPQVACIWIIDGAFSWRRLPRKDGGIGLLFDLPEPKELRWYCEGRSATFTEIEGSVTSGLPELQALAADGAELDEINARVGRAMEEFVEPVRERH